MILWKIGRYLAAAAYTGAVTYTVGKWAIHIAFVERGYQAIGGEYCLIVLTCLAAWELINHLFDTLEEVKKSERDHKKGRRGKENWREDLK